MTDERGNPTNYAYDGAYFTYNYDSANRPTSRTAPNGVTSSYAYDGLDRLTSLMHTAGATTLSGNLYTYNNANNISSWTTASEQKAFTYDAVDRLTNVTNYEMPAENYSYDGVGNRTASHLSASYGFQPFNKLTSTATATYSYDNNGNLISKTDASGTTSYAFNEENQLTQVTLPSGLTMNYKYDGLGRRIQRTTSAGANERYVYDGHDALIDLNADWSVAATYFNDLGIDNHLRQTNDVTGVSYFLNDHLASTTALTDLSGNVVEQLTYDSFGNGAGSTRTRYTYTGREHDADTGLRYYRARFYDPQVGRFISEDPIGFDAGYNWYEYVENNPIRFSDPFGLSKRDRWYGYNNRDFHKWFHRCWKQPGDPDADKQDVEAAYAEWLSRGSPKGGKCYGGPKPDPSVCKEPVPLRRRAPGPTMDELRMRELSAREMEMFWKKVMVGSVVGGTVVVAGPAGIAAFLRWLAGAGAATTPAYVR